ncbi:MAG: acyloxyacyl hydrolase [Nitrospirales bacterium]
MHFALMTLGSVPSQAEPMAVVGVGPRIGVDSPLHEKSIEPVEFFHLLGIGPRIGIGGDSFLGKEQKEDFRQYDLAATFRLPWGWRHRASGWGLEGRFLASAGELVAAGDTGLMATLVPMLALTSRNGGIAIDAGTGVAFFSNYQFGVQDFGGPAQIIGTAGIGFNLYEGFHAGYRFQHFSDAGMYGPTSLGVDMHILDMSYVF